MTRPLPGGWTCRPCCRDRCHECRCWQMCDCLRPGHLAAARTRIPI